MNQDRPNAVSLYGQDGNLDDFPVLRAFQQYIDSEQSKSRKRMLSLGIFFGLLTLAVIAVFVTLLVTVSERNQRLNDRMIEFAMRQPQQAPAAQPVVVQPPVAQPDNSALIQLTTKLEEMQTKLAESQKQVEEARKVAAEATKGPSPEEQEIARLKALLAAEKERAAEKVAAEKAAAEKEQRRQEELEAYRRKRWPELYAAPQPIVQTQQIVIVQKEVLPPSPPEKPAMKPVEKPLLPPTKDFELDDSHAVSYFDDDEADEPSDEPAPKADEKDVDEPDEEAIEPVEGAKVQLQIKGSKVGWQIPED